MYEHHTNMRFLKHFILKLLALIEYVLINRIIFVFELTVVVCAFFHQCVPYEILCLLQYLAYSLAQ